jgi:hypothetical protein
MRPATTNPELVEVASTGKRRRNVTSLPSNWTGSSSNSNAGPGEDSFLSLRPREKAEDFRSEARPRLNFEKTTVESTRRCVCTEARVVAACDGPGAKDCSLTKIRRSLPQYPRLKNSPSSQLGHIPVHRLSMLERKLPEAGHLSQAPGFSVALWRAPGWFAQNAFVTRVTFSRPATRFGASEFFLHDCLIPAAQNIDVYFRSRKAGAWNTQNYCYLPSESRATHLLCIGSGKSGSQTPRPPYRINVPLRFGTIARSGAEGLQRLAIAR